MDRLSALPATFTTGRAERAGLWRRDLYLLRDAGVVNEVSRGVYRKADAPETAHLDLLAVAHRAPLAVVCLISALAVHELTDIGAHDMSGHALRSALAPTAVYRKVSLQQLSQVVVRLPRLRQDSYTAWRRRQTTAALTYPEDFTQVVRQFITFADPLISDQVRHQRWSAADRAWRTSDPAE
ncbi:MAG: hypothetical protein ACRDTF_07290 [Pseudonocardiaceae bacterium]